MEKWWQVVVGAILFIIGFLIGGGYVGRRTNGHIARLRHDLDVLGKHLEQSKTRIEQLTSDNRLARAELAQVRADLQSARATLDKLSDGHGDADRDITRLREVRDRLGAFVEKYSNKIED